MRPAVTGGHGRSLRSGRSSAVELPQEAEVDRGRGSGRRRRVGSPARRTSRSSIPSLMLLGDLEAHGLVEPAPAQLHLERLEEVLGLLVLEREVGVAGDPERRRPPRSPSPTNSVWRWATISSSAGMKRRSSTSNSRGKTVGTLTRAKRRSSLSGSGSATIARDAEGQLGDVRERVARVDGERREHREDALLVDLGHPLALDGVEVVPADDRDAGRGERRHQLVEVHRLLAGDELVGLLLDLGQLLGGGAPVGRRLLDAGGDLVLQGGDADLEELVEVRSS